MRDEAAGALLSRAANEDQRAVLQQGWQARPPTWIQGSTVVNLGDFPTLDDPTARAEREIQTLQWVLDEQRRQSERSGRPGETSANASSDDDDRWFRRLLPRHWVGMLKANREWVVAGGTTLLVIVWGASIFARRPGSAPTEATPATRVRAAQRRRRRRDPLPQ